MVQLKDFDVENEFEWCPGCGNYSIWNGLRRALVQCNLAPWQVMLVSGIGQAAKLPDYVYANAFTSLHGRALPVAEGIRLANHDLKVIINSGDGDMYGEGGNHFTHWMRRNMNITVMVHDNLVYGLTKGQYSPTSRPGYVTKTSPRPAGAIDRPVNPVALALASQATWIGRAFAGDIPHMTAMMVQALSHKGAAVLDIFQPCVTFNKEQGFDFYRQRVYKLQDQPGGYDVHDAHSAWDKAWEWGERIPIGVFWIEEGVPTYEEQVPTLKHGPLVKQGIRAWTAQEKKDLWEQWL